jgi:death-on-curing protein
MSEIIYLSLAEVIAIHAFIMERTGYAPAPLRSEELLESAVLRPQMAAYYEQVDLVRQAVLLAVGISQAQAFLDGNKRTAFAACDAFLRLNGLKYPGPGIDFARQLEAVAEQEDKTQALLDFETWLREQVVER